MADITSKFTDINSLTPFNSNKSSNFKNCYKFNHLIKLNNMDNLLINDHPDEFLPILTLSTNTDAGRDLKRDSFAILKFYNEIDNLTDGCVDDSSDDENNIQINNLITKLSKISNNYKDELKSEYDRLIYLCKNKLGITGGNMKLNELNIEIYEFLIQGYPFLRENPRLMSQPEIQSYLNDKNIRTESINSSDESECGNIIFNEKTRSADEKIRTCDPLKVKLTNSVSPINLTIGVDNSYKFTIRVNDQIEISSDDLINFTNLFPAKNDIRLKIDTTSSLKSLSPLYNNDTIEFIFNKTKEILTKKWISPNVPKTHAMIDFINPDSNDKFIIMGDLHGSFATFIRHLHRFKKLGIIDENCKLLNNYKLIFLGDIVDRGIYGYEIMMLLYCLLIINPNDIYINQGNHEECETNNRYGLSQQMFVQFNSYENFEKINSVTELQSSAIILKNPLNNKYIYMAHGGLPVELLRLSSKLDNINLDKRIYVDSIIGENIRWNDFTTKFLTVPNTIRGIGYFIGTNDQNKAKEKGISLIIRGHNDGMYNTKLIRK